MMKIRYFVAIVLFCLTGILAFGQQTQKYASEPEYMYNTARELYKKKLYVAAQNEFFKIMNDKNLDHSAYKDDAAFYFAMCSMELFNQDVEYQLNKFAEEHPESSNINIANFQLANYYYRDKKYKKALDAYAKVNYTELRPDKQTEFFFKRGYSNYARKNFDAAAKSFYEIIDKTDLYGQMALYFYSHIKYTNEQYQTALIGFKKLENTPKFSSIVPFYILQIYYMQQKYEDVIAYVDEHSEIGALKTAPENAKIVGLSYYRLGRYAESIPYLKNYMEANASASDFDYYELAYAQYSSGKYEDAAKNFSKITRVKDTVGQNAAYIMGDCYLKLGKKLEARRSFETASFYNYNPTIREDALFNFAQLCFELSLSPFNEAITAFVRYIDEYPNSPRTEYAYDYLLDAFMSAKNYQRAMKTIEGLKNKNAKVEMAYQRLAYLRGLEYFTELKYDDAIETFDKSLKYKKYDKTIEAQCYYWRAEANYRLGRVGVAVDQFTEFVNTNGSVNIEEYGRAHYNIGYAYFNKKDYATANTWFRKYEMIDDGENTTVMNDALNRIADCYYINRDFAPAANYYKKAVGIGLLEKDYSLYQLSLAYGGQKMYEEKIWSLQRLLKEYPNSEYSANAIYEIARTYQTSLNNEDSAKYYYEVVVAEYPNSAMKRTAISSLGAIAFNKKQYSKALDYYKLVIAEYPQTDEAQDANNMIKSIYLEMDKPDAYIEYVNNETSVDMSREEQDEILWLAAKKLYLDKKYNDALKSITNYLKEFPDGKYYIEANYYKAELHFYFEEKDDALVSYRVVADAQMSSYSEESTIKTAGLLFDRSRWDEAYNYYTKMSQITENKSTKLICSLGKLRCADNVKNYDNVIAAAGEVLESEKSNDEQKREAKYKMANAYYAKNNKVRSLALYQDLSTEVTSREGAEAKYLTAQINFDNGNDSIAEEIIYDFAQLSTPHAYWLAKSYILLAEIYFQHEDIFSAKHTLQSVLNNYDNETDGIKDQASNTLTSIFEAEETARQEEEALKLKIYLINDGDPDEDLFNVDDLNIEIEEPDVPVIESTPPPAPESTPEPEVEPAQEPSKSESTENADDTQILEFNPNTVNPENNEQNDEE